MSDHDIEDALRAKLHGAIDPRVPDVNAERRVLAALAVAARNDGAHHFGLRVGRGVATAFAAAMVVLVVGGALTVSLLLRNGSNGIHPAPATAPPVIAPTPSPMPSSLPTPTPSPIGLQACDASVLTARFHDQDGAAGTAGGDIALRNNGSVACTLKGYVNLQGIVNGHRMELGVTHSAGGPLLNNTNGTLPKVRLVTLQPRSNAYFAYEHSDVVNGPTPCSATATLLITLPQGGPAVTLTGSPISLCGGFGAKLWIDIAPISSVVYFTNGMPG